MSMVFSDTTDGQGIVQLIDDLCGTDASSYPIGRKTRDVNLALDKALSIIFEVGGDWQFDDSNHTDYPILTTNLVQGQRDYTFVSDGAGNLILDIYKVMVADSSGLFREMLPVNQQGNYLTGLPPYNYSDGQNTQGQPNTYDKTATGIFVDPIPDYTMAGGLKIFINREGSYFAIDDTNKRPGIAGLFHEYLALRPAYSFCQRRGLPQADRIKQEMLEMEQAIRDHYKLREKDNPKQLTARNTCSK